jgi:hypothetical protein
MLLAIAMATFDLVVHYSDAMFHHEVVTVDWVFGA